MSILFINVIGMVLISAIVGWFWLYKPRTKKAIVQDRVDVYVKDGIYEPSYIQAAINQAIILRFIREDPTPCSAMVVFPALKISKPLPLNTPVDITLKLEKPGTYEFTCQMGMYRGSVIAK